MPQLCLLRWERSMRWNRKQQFHGPVCAECRFKIIHIPHSDAHCIYECVGRSVQSTCVCVCVCVCVCHCVCVGVRVLSLFCCLTHPYAGALARASMIESVFMSNGNDRGPNTTVSRRTQRRALMRARFHPGAAPSSCVRFLIFLPLRLYALRLRLAPRAWLTRPFCIVQGSR